MDWIQVLTIIGGNLVMYSLSMKMWMHMDKKVDAIHDEMKDFHGRLEKLDTEFKCYLMGKK